MLLDGFKVGFSNGNTLDTTTGKQLFQVGGTLHVASGQATGTYTGTYGLSVEYQ